MTAILGIPRLDCLGLIEAGVRHLTNGTYTGIPRLDCLGLIEAWRKRPLPRAAFRTDSEA